MKHFATLSIVSCAAAAAACVSTAGPIPAASAAPPELVRSTKPAVAREFPVRRTPARLPTADRLRLSGTHTAAVRMCVAPDGRVASVDVSDPSGTAAFDRALAADVARWRYAPYTAPDGLRVCEQVTVSYVAAR